MARLKTMFSGTSVAILMSLCLPSGRADIVPTPSHPQLTVCADPSNLPYSNRERQGFENKIAELLARDLDSHLGYFWYVEHKGFTRRSLAEGLCEVVISVPEGFSPVATTRPYFSSSYVAVTRSNDERGFKSFDDPWLNDARIGLQLVGNEGATTPPALSLSVRKIDSHITPFPMWSEDEGDNPQGEIIEAVAKEKIDIAFVWGPFAGFFARAFGERLKLTPILNDPRLPNQCFVFSMAIGVRKADEALRDRLQEALNRHANEITDILSEYRVPLVADSKTLRSRELIQAVPTDRGCAVK